MRAIDVHCHLSTYEMTQVSMGKFTKGMEQYYRMKMPVRTPEEMAKEFREADVKTIPTGWDAESASGEPKLSHDYLAKIVKDFPDVFISAWPWQEDMLAVLLHKGNVYNERSGWMPRYFPESLKREIGSRLQDKMMFGSDYPAISPKRWLDEFEKEGYKPEVIEKVFYKNAQRILNLKI